jgi:hypothetical protein
MDRLFPRLTQGEAAALLNEAGIDAAENEILIERRDNRWRATLPGHRMVWLPATREGAERLAVDRRILRLLEERCSFEAPRIVREFGPRSDLRTMVPGVADPFPLSDRLRRDPVLARQIGRSLGLILAEQHTAFGRTT